MATETFLDGRVVLHCGDCVEVMAQLAENSVDSVVTDPPYLLNFMSKRWDKSKEAAIVRLVTPPGGTVLDMFAGTGTTGEAAFYEGMRAVLIEREPEYQADIRRRMALVMAGPDERARESIKANGKAQGHDDLPLFNTAAE